MADYEQPNPGVDNPGEQDTVENHQPGEDTVDNDRGYEERYKEVQGAYTKSQQELMDLRKQFESTKQEMDPALNYYKEQQEFQQWKNGQQKPKTVWEYEGGIDGALSERDRELSSLKEELEAIKQQTSEQNIWQKQNQFIMDQKRLFNEFGTKEFGSEEAFSEALRELPNYDPNWQRNYLDNTSYDTLKRSYLIMRGAAQYNPDSTMAKYIAQKQEDERLAKESNYIGNGVPISFGPSKTDPNMPYMTPISQT